MDLKIRVPGFLKEEGLKHQKIQKVTFPEKMQISFNLVPLAAPLQDKSDIEKAMWNEPGRLSFLSIVTDGFCSNASLSVDPSNCLPKVLM